MRASREIAANTLIVTEPPIIVGPKWNSEDEDLSSLSFWCIGCFQPIKVLNSKCPKCFWPACSTECIGLTNPELHSIECGLLKVGKGPANKTDFRSIQGYYRSDALLALKIVLLQRKNPKKFKALMEMESNEKNRLLTYNFREAEERINYLEENFFTPLRKAEEKTGQAIIPLKDKTTMHRIYGIIETNAMYISLPTGTEICGLYPTACLMQHSCVPNCNYNFDMKNGFKIIVEAARDLITGEHLTTTYSHILWSTQLRQQHLKDTKYFTCTCERCKDPSELGTNFSTLRCLGSEEGPCNGLQLPIDPISPTTVWACNKCPVTITSEQVSFITGKMNEEIETTLSSSPTPKVIEELIEKLSQFLHSTHYLMFSLKHALLQLYGRHKDASINSLNEEKLNKKLHLCNELLQVALKLDPYSVRIPIYNAILLFEKHNSLREMFARKLISNLDEAKKCLLAAQNVLRNELDTIQGKELNQKIEDALLQY